MCLECGGQCRRVLPPPAQRCFQQRLPVCQDELLVAAGNRDGVAATAIVTTGGLHTHSHS
jgi:hypothetical protein